MSTILVTGATDGIGLETAKELAQRGHEVVLHGRNAEKLALALEVIQRTVPDARLQTACADMADLGQVVQMAQELNARLHGLDVLLNNAGVYMLDRQLSTDGFEMTMAVNYFAPFVMTRWLKPLLRQSADPRVVTVSSVAHQRGRIEFDNMNAEREFDAYQAYANSKLADTLFANALAHRESWLCSNSLHPGVIDTKLLHIGFNMKGDTLQNGARTSVYLATSPEVRGVTGCYFDDCKQAQCSPLAADHELDDALWRWTENALRVWMP
ncbi:MAG: SDR family oxidoreductase [Gammaproteobacteria bacterium]|nr:SDR family oxidoreductase [Gammaproteobacteria bacterium]MDD2929442.1 SDR family oxidoreductase [Sideroxydans sp.]